ncbi:MAG: carboxypeptidase regulatory-like domain-containing protein [Clostridia bacterium]|nr:carboxypeptidase regulatory-like domain-containing protein [Clostridia bacterium]
MKKTAQILLVAMLVFSAISVSAYMPDENDRYSITYNAGVENAGNMYGLAAIAGTDENMDVAADNALVYVYQTTADAEGNITFNSFGPIGPDPSDPDYVESTVFIGGQGFDTAQMIGVLEAASSSGDDAESAAIRGMATDSVSPSKPITVTVTGDDGVVVGTATANDDGTYEIYVPHGTYSIKFTKEGFCSCTYRNVSVTGDIDFEMVDMTNLAGDIVANGTVNIMDLSALLNDYNKQIPYNELSNPLSDINGNGSVNIADLSLLLSGYNSSDIIK